MRTAFYRHVDSLVADWVVLRRTPDGNVHIHSNTLNTDLTIPESNLVAADRDMTSPMFLAAADPTTSHGVGSATSAVGVPSLAPTATSAPRVSSPVGAGGQPLARNTDPQTAHDAADVAKLTAAATRLKVLLAHADAGERGLCGDELEVVTGLPYQTCGPRRPALEADGLIAPTGLRRPNRRGNMEAVYAITDAGRITAERAK